MVNLSEHVTGLDTVGTQISNFLINLLPGVVAFVFVMAIIGGVIGLFAAIIFIIKKGFKKV